MAMSVTTTEQIHSSVKQIKYEWVSAADGTASGATTYSYDGQILQFVTIPSGVAAPTDNYDITITDDNNIDVLISQGADRDTATTEYVTSTVLGCVADSKLTLNVSNAGDTKAGTVILYVR